VFGIVLLLDGGVVEVLVLEFVFVLAGVTDFAGGNIVGIY
jgi:hypothetical protein